MHTISHGSVRTLQESLHWKLTVAEKSLAAPGNRICVGSVLFWCSTNWATSPPKVYFLKKKLGEGREWGNKQQLYGEQKLYSIQTTASWTRFPVSQQIIYFKLFRSKQRQCTVREKLWSTDSDSTEPFWSNQTFHHHAKQNTEKGKEK